MSGGSIAGISSSRDSCHASLTGSSAVCCAWDDEMMRSILDALALALLFSITTSSAPA